MVKKTVRSVSLILVFCIGFFFLFVNHNLSRSFHHKWTATTDLYEENINGMNLFDNIRDQEFLDKYGEQLHESAKTETHTYFQIEKNIEIAVNSNGEIMRFIVNGKVPTSKGVREGDSIKEVKAAYGKKKYSRVEQGVDILGYVDKKRYQSIEFWHYKDKVLFYRYDDNSMK